jgi:hypothetical protein
LQTTIGRMKIQVGHKIKRRDAKTDTLWEVLEVNPKFVKVKNLSTPRKDIRQIEPRLIKFWELEDDGRICLQGL